MKNVMKAKLKTGAPVIGFQIMGNWAEIVEIVGLLGSDFVFLDGEHGALGLPEIASLVRAAECVGITPIARVPRNAPDVILRYLDIGVQGIIVPNVNSREEAERAVKAVKYYPLGERGCGYGHSMDYSLKQPFAEHVKEANRETMVITQCEAKEGLDNLEEIVKVPGIDIIFIGPGDLSQSLGVPGQLDHPSVQEAIARAKKIVLASDKYLGMVGWDGDYARDAIAEGARFINMSVHALMAKAIKEYLSTARAED
jgi:4-hydroxy-2-oxoheptanedioate aldolase